MDIIWKVDLSDEETDRRNVETVAMQLIKDFRAIPHSQPYKIKIAFHNPFCQAVYFRLADAGLPVELCKGKA